MIEVAESQFLDPRWRLSNLYTITDKTGRQVVSRLSKSAAAQIGKPELPSPSPMPASARSRLDRSLFSLFIDGKNPC